MSNYDAPAVVIDNGSGVCKAGFANDDTPTTSVLSIVGQSRNVDVSIDNKLYFYNKITYE